MIGKRQIILFAIVLLLVVSLSVESVEAVTHKKIGGWLGDVAHGAGDLLGGALDSIKECLGLCPSKDCDSPVNFVSIEKKLEDDKNYQVRKIKGNVCYRASSTDSSLPELFDITYELKSNDNIIKSSKTPVFTVNNDCKKKCQDFEIDTGDNLLKKLTDVAVYPVANKVSITSFNVHHYTYHLGSSLGTVETSKTEEIQQPISNTAKSQYTFTGPILIYTTGTLDDFNTLSNKLKGSRNVEIEIKSKLDPTFSINGNVLSKYSQLWILNNADVDISQAKAAIKEFYNNGGGLFISSHDGFVTKFTAGIKKVAMDFSWEKFTNTNIDQNTNYAKNIAEFIESNPYENKILCEHRGGKWTGSSCCGLPDKDGKDWYYNDPSGSLEGVETVGGCWNNAFVASGTNPSETVKDAQGIEQTKTLKQIINVDGEFNYCKNLPPSFQQPSIELIFPKGGENLRNGEKYRILWKSTGVDKTVNIYLSDYLIATAPNIGYYDWDPGSVRGEVYEFYPGRISISSGGIKVTSEIFNTLSKTSSISSMPSTPSNINTSLPIQDKFYSFNLKPVSTC